MPRKQIPHIDEGAWVRLALVADWRDNGWYEVWADPDGSGTMTRVVDRQTGVDLLNGRPKAAWGIGLYHRLDLFDGTVLPDHPRQETVYTEYANAQITAFEE